MTKRFLYSFVFCISLLFPLSTYADNIVTSGIIGDTGTLQDSQFEDGSTLDSGNAWVLNTEDEDVITSEAGEPLLTIGITTLQGFETHNPHVVFLLTEAGAFIESEASEPLLIWNVEIEQATPVGDIVGSTGVASTDNAIARYDGTAGALQNSSITIDDNDNLIITGSTVGTNLAGGLAIVNDTAATAALANGAMLWAADHVAGDSLLNIMGEKDVNPTSIGSGRAILRAEAGSDIRLTLQKMSTTTSGATIDWRGSDDVVDASFDFGQSTALEFTLNNGGQLWIFDENGNLGIGTGTFATSLAKGLSLGIGTAASATAPNVVNMWAADFAADDTRLYLMSEAQTDTLSLGGVELSFSALGKISGTTITVDNNGADTVAILGLENTGGDFQIFRDDASPESVITGSIGDECTDSTGGVKYIKNTGSATNTGWAALRAIVLGIKHDGFIIRDPAETQTTDATVTVVDNITLLDENTYNVEAWVVGVQSDGSDRASYHLAGTVYRTGAGSATLQGSVTSLHSQESIATVDATLTVDTNDVRVSVTGIAAETWEWGTTMKYINMSN